MRMSYRMMVVGCQPGMGIVIVALCMVIIRTDIGMRTVIVDLSMVVVDAPADGIAVSYRTVSRISVSVQPVMVVVGTDPGV